MIKTFNTTDTPSASTGGSAPSTSGTTSGGGMNKIVLAVVILGAIYVGYRFVVKPMMDAKKAKEDEK